MTPLTYAEALGMQADYAKSMGGIAVVVQKVGKEISRKIDLPRGKWSYELEFILSHYLLTISTLKAYSRVGAIGFYPDVKLSSITFRTLEEARSRYNRLVANTLRKSEKHGILLRNQLGMIDATVQENMKGKQIYSYNYLTF